MFGLSGRAPESRPHSFDPSGPMNMNALLWALLQSSMVEDIISITNKLQIQIVQGNKQEIKLEVRFATLPVHTIYFYWHFIYSETSFCV